MQTKDQKNKIKQKDKAPRQRRRPCISVMVAAAAVAVGRRAALLTRGCWPSRRTEGSESAGPDQESPSCHLQGSVEVGWEDGLSEGPAP